uniref:Protein kinase domain-containing protein n=1 Tax=Elaeophora elaphi TaxID=1147741 RepID=A0A0R3RUX0_9BILA
MGTPIGPPKIAIGDKIRDQFLVKKKLGEGSCGMVYLVLNIRDTKRAAMKVEPLMKSKDDEILKMEVYVLRKMQRSKHVCQLLAAGKTASYNFLIMSLLGKELSDIRRRLQDRKMSLGSVLKIGIQSTTVIKVSPNKAIHDLHKIGFVHRDIKPSNFAMGRDEKANTVFMFDFGLARQIMFPGKDGKLKLREARKKVAFRGTVRYCSLNVHLYKEQGRHDDLWSMFYMLIELLTATLPWKGMARKDSAHVKETVADRILLAVNGCPDCFADINNHLKSLTYQDTPNYGMLLTKFTKELNKLKIKPTDPFEWNEKGFLKQETNITSEHDKDVKVEIDKVEDTDTGRAVDESVQSEESSAGSETSDLAAENTLEILNPNKK